MVKTTGGPEATTPRPPGATMVMSSCDLLTRATIERVTGLTLPAGRVAELHEPAGWSICNWEDITARAAVQVQLHLVNGRADFARVRQELVKSDASALRTVRVAGADDAYTVPDQGVVGLLVHGAFVQVMTIGGRFDSREHVALAEAVVKELAQ